MLDFIEILYRKIGIRMKQYRNSRDMTQEQFAEYLEINTPPLVSKIENAKKDSRNPYLLPKKLISNFEKKTNISPVELVWGTEEERKNFTKLLLLAMLLNGSEDVKKEPVNPFFYSDDYRVLFQWAKKQKNIAPELKPYLQTACGVLENGLEIKDNMLFSPSKLEPPENDMIKTKEQSISAKELLLQTQEYFKDAYGFFFDSTNYNDYMGLNCGNETGNSNNNKYEVVSNILLKSILSEPLFAQSFITRLTNTIWNKPQIQPDSSNSIKYELNDFIMGKGKYGLLVLDYKEYDYCLFINAFNVFWEKKEQTYMGYFNQKLFNKEMLENKGLKEFTNKYILEILSSQEFITLIQQSENIDMYYDEETILSNYYQQLTLQELLLRNRMSAAVSEDETKKMRFFYDYISNMQINTMKYITDKDHQ